MKFGSGSGEFGSRCGKSGSGRGKFGSGSEEFGSVLAKFGSGLAKCGSGRRKFGSADPLNPNFPKHPIFQDPNFGKAPNVLNELLVARRFGQKTFHEQGGP